MKPPRPIASLILDLHGRKVMIDADLAEVYGVTTKVLNQAVARNTDRFPADFVFRLTPNEKLEVVTNCDHLARLKFSPVLPRAFTEHGAIMAATVLNSPQAVAMSVYVVRAFIGMRGQLAANAAILKRLAEIDRTLLQHDTSSFILLPSSFRVPLILHPSSLKKSAPGRFLCCSGGEPGPQDQNPFSRRFARCASLFFQWEMTLACSAGSHASRS